jgi:hypothetical protein
MRAPHILFAYPCTQAHARPRTQGVKPPSFSPFRAVPAALAGAPPAVSRGDATGQAFRPGCASARSPSCSHACSRGCPRGAPPVMATPTAPTGSHLPAVACCAPARTSAALPLMPVLLSTHTHPRTPRVCEPPAFARSSPGRRLEPPRRPAVAPAMASASPRMSPSSGSFLSTPSGPVGPGGSCLGARGPSAVKPHHRRDHPEPLLLWSIEPSTYG